VDVGGRASENCMALARQISQSMRGPSEVSGFCPRSEIKPADVGTARHRYPHQARWPGNILMTIRATTSVVRFVSA
jgi:hypothetical protein